MTILYSSTHNLADDNVARYLRLLPDYMNTYINKFVYPNDRKQRLLARLLLRQGLLQTLGEDSLLNHWQTDANHKPYLNDWHFFNISHAGEYVVLVYDTARIGIDIEKHVALDFTGISEYFHSSEADFIAQSTNKLSDFYSIWTKKEALLKAAGSGIVNGLQHASCLQESVYFGDTTWYFASVSINPSYTCHVCSNHQIKELKLQYVSL